MRIAIAAVNILLAILTGVVGFLSLNLHFYGNQKNYDQHLLLLEDGIETSFEADTVFIPATMHADGEETFALQYTFEVYHEEFNGIYYLNDTSGFDASSLSGVYLKDNPGINAVDVEQRLRELEHSMQNGKNLQYGLIAMGLSLLLTFLGIRSIRMHSRRTLEDNSHE